MELAYMNVKINGLYFWGEGWNTDTKNRWNEFWKNRKGDIFWTFFEKDDGFQTTQYLVSTYANIYLHPMGFEVLARQSGGCYHWKKDGTKVRVYSEFEELKRILNELSEDLGCEVKCSEIKSTEVDL